jgi:hypothetical protein
MMPTIFMKNICRSCGIGGGRLLILRPTLLKGGMDLMPTIRCNFPPILKESAEDTSSFLGGMLRDISLKVPSKCTRISLSALQFRRETKT